MQLLDCAGIDKKDKQIVLTAVDYSKEDLYEQMKKGTSEILWGTDHVTEDPYQGRSISHRVRNTV